MPRTSLKILLVDDDPMLIEMHSALLENNDYSVITAEDGVQGLVMLNNFHEDIGVVVSDITMPNMDGYEFCKQIKQNDITKDIPVIFVSARSNLDEKMKGYEVGADDFITKPVNEDELSKKISTLLNMREQQNKLSKQVSTSQSMAMQAKTFSSELVQVIEFYKQILNANDYNKIAKYYFDAMSSFDLVSVIQFTTPDKVITLSESGIVSPLESNVIEMAKDKGQFVDFGARTIVNYNAFSLLIKNMPLADSEKYGRIKDILGMIGNGIEAKLQQLNNEVITNKKDQIFLSIQDSINHIELSFSDLQKNNITAIEDMNEQLHEAIMPLGLTKTQQSKIQQITNTCLERSNKAFCKELSIDDNLKNIYQQFHLALDTKAGT